jgi:hypothetical protein
MCREILFFLGGADLEMQEIRSLLNEQGLGQAIRDKHLSWGARASDYEAEIRQALRDGKRPVLIELTPDLPEDPFLKDCVLIDHHGERARKDMPSSLRQVFDLLKPGEELWTRWRELVSINDVSHIRGLKAYGASDAEIRQVRDADRRVQGVTHETEELSRRAIRSASGDKTFLVVTTEADTSSAIMDFLDPVYGGPDPENTLVLMPGKLAFYGEGRFIDALRDLPGCWYGGGLPERGYWGVLDPEGKALGEVRTRLADVGLKMP